MNKSKVGFIGAGYMGYGMAKNFALSVGKGETQPKYGTEDKEETPY